MKQEDLQNLLDSLDEGPIGKRKDWQWDKAIKGTSHLNSKQGKLKSAKGKAKNRKVINQYNLQGEFIKTHNGVLEAQNSIKKGNQVSEMINGRLKTALGFLWIEKDKATPEVIELSVKNAISKKKRRIAQYTMDGQLVKVFDSLNDAYNTYGYSIRDYIEGKTKHAYGYIWEYA